MTKLKTILSLAALAALAVGCGGAIQSGPGWVAHQSGTAEFDGKKAVYAVGVSKSRVVKLARAAACDEARKELGKFLNQQFKGITESAAESISDGADGENAGIRIAEAFKGKLDIKLSGVGCVKKWKDPADGSMYALARLESDTIKGILEDVAKNSQNADNLSKEKAAAVKKMSDDMLKKINF